MSRQGETGPARRERRLFSYHNGLQRLKALRANTQPIGLNERKEEISALEIKLGKIYSHLTHGAKHTADMKERIAAEAAAVVAAAAASDNKQMDDSSSTSSTKRSPDELEASHRLSYEKVLKKLEIIQATMKEGPEKEEFVSILKEKIERLESHLRRFQLQREKRAKREQSSSSHSTTANSIPAAKISTLFEKYRYRLTQYEHTYEKIVREVDEFTHSEGDGPRKQAKLAELRIVVAQAQRKFNLMRSKLAKVEQEESEGDSLQGEDEMKHELHHHPSIASVPGMDGPDAQGRHEQRIRAYHRALKELEHINQMEQDPYARRNKVAPVLQQLYKIYTFLERWDPNIAEKVPPIPDEDDDDSEDDSEGSDVHEFIIPPNSHMSSDRVNTSLKWLKEKYAHGYVRIRDIKIKSQLPPGKGYILAIYVGGRGGKHSSVANLVQEEIMRIINLLNKKNKSHAHLPPLVAISVVKPHSLPQTSATATPSSHASVVEDAQTASSSSSSSHPRTGEINNQISQTTASSSTTNPTQTPGKVSAPKQPVGHVFHDAFIPANNFMESERVLTAIDKAVAHFANLGVVSARILPYSARVGASEEAGHIIRVEMSNKLSNTYKSVWGEIVNTVIACIRLTRSHPLHMVHPTKLIQMFKPQPVESERVDSSAADAQPSPTTPQTEGKTSSPSTSAQDVKDNTASKMEATTAVAKSVGIPIGISQSQPHQQPQPTSIPFHSNPSGKTSDLATPMPTPVSSTNSSMAGGVCATLDIEPTLYTDCDSMKIAIKRMLASYTGLREILFVWNPSETDPSYTVRVYGTQQFTQSNAVFHEVKEVIRIETEKEAKRAAVAAAKASKVSSMHAPSTDVNSSKPLSSKSTAVAPSPPTIAQSPSIDMASLAAMITAQVTAQVQQAMGNQIVAAPSLATSFDINAFVQQKVAEQMELIRIGHSSPPTNLTVPQSAAVDHGVSFFNHSPSLEPGVVQTSIDEDGEMVFEMVNPGEGESASSQLMSPAGEIVTPVVVDKSAMFSSSVKALPIPPKPISLDAMVANASDLPSVSNSQRLVGHFVAPNYALGLIQGPGDSKINTLRGMNGIVSITMKPSQSSQMDHDILITATSQGSLDAVNRELNRLVVVAKKKSLK